MKNDFADGDVNMDTEPDMLTSVMDTNLAKPVVNDKAKRKPALGNGKGDLSKSSICLEPNH